MLVLTRKTNDGLLIGDDIVVTILGVDGDRVKIGIDAPRHVRVLRRELADAVKAENLAAARSGNAEAKNLDALKHLLHGDQPPGNGKP
jgi:carbon storage regulator